MIAEYSLKAILLLFISYNTYYGWNEEPMNDIEKQFDDFFNTLVGLWFGYILFVIIKYVKFKVENFK